MEFNKLNKKLKSTLSSTLNSKLNRKINSKITIRHAKIEEAELLSSLAYRSKAYWNISEDYLKKCKPVLKISKKGIQSWPCFVAIADNKTLGFYMLKIVDDEKRLEHLWVEPEYIGKKVGSLLFEHCLEEARTLDWTCLRIVSDPNARGFYEKRGAKLIGRLQSEISPTVFLPYLEIRIEKKY